MLCLRIDEDTLFEKYKAIWTNIEDLKEIELDALPAYDDRYIKITANGDKFNTNFSGSDVSDNGVESEFLTVISIDYLRVYGNKHCLQVHLDNYAHKIMDKKIIDYLDDDLFWANED